MKKAIVKLISICFIVFCSCNQKTELSNSFSRVDLNNEIKNLWDIYLQSYPKLKKGSFGLRLGVHHYDRDHFMIFLSNFHLDNDGYKEGYEEEWNISDYKGYRIYVLDDREVLSKITNKKLWVHYKISNDSVIPNTYGGNLWEIHFRKDTIAEMHFIPENAKEEIVKALGKKDDTP